MFPGATKYRKPHLATFHTSDVRENERELVWASAGGWVGISKWCVLLPLRSLFLFLVYITTAAKSTFLIFWFDNFPFTVPSHSKIVFFFSKICSFLDRFYCRKCTVISVWKKSIEMGFVTFCRWNTRERFIDLHVYSWSSLFLC